MGMNRSKWDSLTPTEQAIIRTACSDVNHLSIGEFTYQNGVYLEKLVNEEEVQLRQFPEDVMARVQEISADIRSDAGNEGDLERRIYESFEDALIKMRAWASISDSPYMVAREL